MSIRRINFREIYLSWIGHTLSLRHIENEQGVVKNGPS